MTLTYYLMLTNYYLDTLKNNNVNIYTSTLCW